MLRRIKRFLRPRTRWHKARAVLASLTPWQAFRWHAGAPFVRYQEIHPKGAQHPLLLRIGGPDIVVFATVWDWGEYAALEDIAPPRLVIDAGANIGCSSAWFLSRWPDATVIAVEPDPENFDLLHHNLHPYGERAQAIRAGVWSHTCGLKLEEAPYRDGAAWARQVREVRDGETPDFPALSIPDLIDQSGHDRCGVLKVDIEGAEAIVFGADTAWLDRVDHLVIELHDDSQFGLATEVFNRAMEGRGWSLSQSGEKVVARAPGV